MDTLNQKCKELLENIVKQQELQRAQKSKLQSKKIDGVHFKVLIHPQSRSVERREDMNHDDWHHMQSKTVAHIKDKPAGHYLAYSNKHKQGMVYQWYPEHKKIELITVLPKGKHNPQEGTKRHLIESYIKINPYFKNVILTYHEID